MVQSAPAPGSLARSPPIRGAQVHLDAQVVPRRSRCAPRNTPPAAHALYILPRVPSVPAGGQDVQSAPAPGSLARSPPIRGAQVHLDAQVVPRRSRCAPRNTPPAAHALYIYSAVSYLTPPTQGSRYPLVRDGFGCCRRGAVDGYYSLLSGPNFGIPSALTCSRTPSSLRHRSIRPGPQRRTFLTRYADDRSNCQE